MVAPFSVGNGVHSYHLSPQASSRHFAILASGRYSNQVYALILVAVYERNEVRDVFFAGPRSPSLCTITHQVQTGLDTRTKWPGMPVGLG